MCVRPKHLLCMYVTAASSLEDIVVVLRSFEQKKKQVLQLFTNITKQDVTLNNYLCRSKSVLPCCLGSA